MADASTETDVTGLGAYAKWQSDKGVYVSGNVQLGFGDVEFNRTVTDGLDSVKESNKADLFKYGAYAELGYDFFADRLTVSPYMALSYNAAKLDAVKEDTVIGLTVSDVDVAETKAHVGVRFDYELNQNLYLTGYGEYADAFDRDNGMVTISSNVDNTIQYGYQAPPFDKDYFLYGVGLNYTSGSKWNWFGELTGNASKSSDYLIQLGLKYHF